MTKRHNNSGIGPDNWLHILTHALALFADEGGQADVVTDAEGNLVIVLPGVKPTDRRLHPEFVQLIDEVLA